MIVLLGMTSLILHALVLAVTLTGTSIYLNKPLTDNISEIVDTDIPEKNLL